MYTNQQPWKSEDERRKNLKEPGTISTFNRQLELYPDCAIYLLSEIRKFHKNANLFPNIPAQSIRKNQSTANNYYFEQHWEN